MVDTIKEGLVLQERRCGRYRMVYGERILPHKPSMVLSILLEEERPIGVPFLIKKLWGDNHYVDVHSHNVIRNYLSKIRRFLEDIGSDLCVNRDINYRIKIEKQN